MRPLPHPPEAEEHPDSIEVLRGWIVNGEFSNPIPLSFGRLGSGQNRLTHLAVYLAALPSRGQEIDDKLQSNSR
jgi:hypothetical protein